MSASMLPNARSRRSTPRAFTLIELLVVITILGLLAAILMPTLQSARTASNRSASLSNSRQITLALHTYAGDNRESLPFVQRAFWNVSSWQPLQAFNYGFWSGQLVTLGYISSPRVFWAPGRDTGPINTNNPLNNVSGFSEYRYTGYAANIGALGHGEDRLLNFRDNISGAGINNSINGMPLRLSEGSSPKHDSFLLLIEGASPTNMNGWFRGTPAIYTSNSATRSLPYHYEGALVRTYVDGHAFAANRNTGGLINNATAGFTTANASDFGYDPSRAGTLLGGFAGGWAYVSVIDYNQYKPWHLQWRSDGWKN